MKRRSEMSQLEPLVGEWKLEASFPGAPPGHVVFEWMTGNEFLIQRWEVPVPEAPDGLAIIGPNPDGTGFLQHYFDLHDPSRLHFVLNNPARFEGPRIAKPQVDPLGSLGCRFLEPTKGLSANRLQTGGSRRHSRPRCSNDNPYSESQVRTLKYRPDFPARFGSFEDARGFCGDFFGWYNKEHRHSGIAFHTPADVHYGRAGTIRAHRAKVLDAAYAAHPERFV